MTAAQYTTTRSPRIALIGAGAIAEFFYLPALSKNREILKNLTLVDLDQERARQMAGRFNAARHCADYREILDEIDGAIIAVPSHLHYPIAMDILKRGIPVLCEKPLAEVTSHAQEMVKQADASGVTLMVNNTRRLYASYQKVKSIIIDKSLGELRSIQYYDGEEFKWPTASGYYFNTALSPRGVLLDRGAHILDVVCWWLGTRPALLDCRIDSAGGREAVTQVIFQHEACKGEVFMSLLGKFPCIYRVEFENGVLEGDIYDYQTVVMTTATGHRKVLRLKTGENAYEDIGTRMVNNFIDVLTGNAGPLVQGRDVLDSLEFIDECYSSAAPFDAPWYARLPELKSFSGSQSSVVME